MTVDTTSAFGALLSTPAGGGLGFAGAGVAIGLGVGATEAGAAAAGATEGFPSNGAVIGHGSPCTPPWRLSSPST